MSRRLSAIFASGPPPIKDNKSRSRTSSPAPQPKSPGKLAKQAPQPHHGQKPSGQFLAPIEPTLPSLQDIRLDYEINGSSEPSLLPPPSIHSGFHSRTDSAERSYPGTPGSQTPRSRPTTPSIQLPDQPPSAPGVGPQGGDSAERLKKKHWWNNSKGGHDQDTGPAAWVAGHPQRLPYDTRGLLDGRPMQELWADADANCYVYLFPRDSGRGASFKVDSAVFSSSPVLTKLAFGDIYSNAATVSGDRKAVPWETRVQHLSIHDPSTPPMSPKQSVGHGSSTSSQDSRGRQSAFSDTQEAHLYLPVKLSSEAPAGALSTPNSNGGFEYPDVRAMEDLQTLIDYRNFFAFLCGQSLVATERRSTFFHIFMTIAGILKSFQFTNADGSTYGEVAHGSFDNYVEELGLADVRASREKTIEGIVLGERMRSVVLYNEAFTHGVGKHNDIASVKSPKFNMISPITQNRLIRASMDLDKRVASVRLVLTDFDFPFLFSGIMNSKTSAERKEGVRFDQWKESFLGMRKFVMGMYKQRYGDWPPKASSKKNSLETSGLNRLVLESMYHDLTSLYDLLVDRSNLTTRTIDGLVEDGGRDSAMVRGLRNVLSEYDRSSPPVKPPIPFDLPRLPTLKTTRPDYGSGDWRKDSKAATKKLKDDEIQPVLRASWNGDARVTPFVDAFREMEKRAAHGCTLMELEDLRIGQWIFMYVVLQALPMLAGDAPGLKHIKGVEYFLCEPPRNGLPWADPNAAAAGGARRTWFSVNGTGGGVVSLPADIVEHGVEGIFRRSHCWQMAEIWAASNPVLNEALHMQQHSGHAGYENNRLQAPSSTNDLLRPDSSISHRSGKRHSSLGMGLEALPVPPGITPDIRSPSPAEMGRPKTPQHSVDASKTFDSILASVDTSKPGKKKK